jgi:hypothetical protein
MMWFGPTASVFVDRARLRKRGRGCDGGFRGEGRSSPSSFAREQTIPSLDLVAKLSVLDGRDLVRRSKSSNFVVRHMDIVDADKLLIYEICRHYLAFDTDGMISFPKLT